MVTLQQLEGLLQRQAKKELNVAAWLAGLADVCALGFDVHHVQALTAGHEELVAFGSAEAEVRTDFR